MASPEEDEIIELDIVDSAESTQSADFVLTLTRFKGTDNLTINLPPNGVILLDGPNGVGKTTIMDAISFVLYDGMGNACYPRSTRNTRKQLPTTAVKLVFPTVDPVVISTEHVTVDFTEDELEPTVHARPKRYRVPLGLTIYRQRRPNLLQVTGPGINLIDEPAQHYINHLFGSSSSWVASGYIKPGDLCAFFGMTAADKLRFIQELSIPDAFDRMFNRSNEKIAEAIKQNQELDAHVKVYQEMYLQRYERSSAEVQNAVLWPFEYLAEQMLNYGTLINPDEGDFTLFISCLNDLEKFKRQDYDNTVRAKRFELSQAQTQLVQIREQVKRQAELQNNLAQLTYSYEQIPDPSLRIIELERSIEQLQQQVTISEQLALRTQLLAVKTRLEHQLSHINVERTSSYTLPMIDRFIQISQGLSIEEINHQLSKITRVRESLKQREQYDNRRKYLDLVTQLKAQLSLYPQVSVKDELEQVEKQIWTSQLSKRTMPCPKCEAPIYFTGTSLQLAEHQGHEDINELNAKKTQLQEQESRYQQRGQIEQTLKQYEFELIKYPEVECPVFNESVNVNDLHQREQALLYQRKLREEVPPINLLEERLLVEQMIERERLLKELRTVSADLDRLGSLESTSVDESSFSSTTGETSTLKSLIVKQKDELTLNRGYQRQRNVFSGQIEQVLSLIQPVNPQLLGEAEQRVSLVEEELKTLDIEHQKTLYELGIQIKLAELSDLYDKHQRVSQAQLRVSDRLARLQKIRSCLITAEYVILERVLDVINLKLVEILQVMFRDPVTVVLRSLRQLKTTDRIKPEINLEITHKGDEFSSLKDVSSGERGRISLALLIAFAQYVKAPFLLLDESLTSLDMSTKTIAIDTLKEYLPGKLILVVHHGATQGIYNNVISL